MFSPALFLINNTSLFSNQELDGSICRTICATRGKRMIIYNKRIVTSFSLLSTWAEVEFVELLYKSCITPEVVL